MVGILDFGGHSARSPSRMISEVILLEAEWPQTKKNGREPDRCLPNLYTVASQRTAERITPDVLLAEGSFC